MENGYVNKISNIFPRNHVSSLIFIFLHVLYQYLVLVYICHLYGGRYSEKLLFVCHPAKLNTIHKYNQPIQAQQIMQEENYQSAEYHVLAL